MAFDFKQPVSADDFFGDLDRKKKKKEVSNEIASPEITGLREAPLPDPPFVLEGIDTASISTAGLRDEILPPHEDIEV